MNLFRDAVHNLIDGLIGGGSYTASIPLGIATTTALIFHEIPQELGDFYVPVYGGFNKRKALMFNFLTALTAVFGAIIAFVVGSAIEGFVPLLIPFAAGNLSPSFSAANTGFMAEGVALLIARACARVFLNAIVHPLPNCSLALHK
jgi:hypothetical protein